MSLAPEKWACLEADRLRLYAGFGKRDAFDGYEVCFDNRQYGTGGLDGKSAQKTAWDTPFTVFKNCFAAAGEPNKPDFEACLHAGYVIGLEVQDVKREGADAGKDGYKFPVRKPAMFAEVEFTAANSFFNVMPVDSARVQFWVQGPANPAGASLAPDGYVAKCEEDAVAN